MDEDPFWWSPPMRNTPSLLWWACNGLENKMQHQGDGEPAIIPWGEMLFLSAQGRLHIYRHNPWSLLDYIYYVICWSSIGSSEQNIYKCTDCRILTYLALYKNYITVSTYLFIEVCLCVYVCILVILSILQVAYVFYMLSAMSSCNLDSGQISIHYCNSTSLPVGHHAFSEAYTTIVKTAMHL